MRRLCVFLAALFLSTQTFAIDSEKAFEDPELQARYAARIRAPRWSGLGAPRIDTERFPPG